MRKTDKMVLVNGIEYKKPKNPTVIVCMDGVSPQYLDKSIKAKSAPTFKKFKKEGFYSTAYSVVPSITNPNNVSIITGVLPEKHGITTSGLMFNRKKWDYELISAYEHIKCDTILQVFNDKNIKVAAITAKDKLRFFISAKDEDISMSSEVAHQLKGLSIENMIKYSIKETKEGKLLETVDDKWMYSEKPSHFCLDIAIALLEGEGPYIPEVIYVSLTDYIPHRHMPGTKVANSFIKGIDDRIRALDKMGCTIGITADHGMNDKYKKDGSPNAIWLKDILDRNNIRGYKILLTAADKYLAHHGCLGSSAFIYFANRKDAVCAYEILKKVKGVEETLLNEEAAEKYGLPKDLIGDLFLLSNKNTVLGTTRKEHHNIPVRLRSHGGLNEQKVPFIINKPLNTEYESKKNKKLRNFNIFEYVLNGG